MNSTFQQSSVNSCRDIVILLIIVKRCGVGWNGRKHSKHALDKGLWFFYCRRRFIFSGAAQLISGKFGKIQNRKILNLIAICCCFDYADSCDCLYCLAPSRHRISHTLRCFLDRCSMRRTWSLVPHLPCIRTALPLSYSSTIT